MKINKIFNIKKSQPELDFVNIDISTDIPLFIDPFFLSIRKDNWSQEATRTIRVFFQQIIFFIKKNKISEAKKLFNNLHEPNSTCLGLSKGVPMGRGIGTENIEDIFNSIIKSKAIQTGLIQDLEDNLLFIDGFGKDKLSDVTTNIIREHLIEYTQMQCNLYGIPLTNSTSGFFWNRKNFQWENRYKDMLIIEGRKILLVPKGIVSFCNDYIPQKYFQHFILNFLQHEHLTLNSALVQERRDGTKYVTKKDLKKENLYSKEFLREFTQRNPQILINFKNQTTTLSLSDSEFEEIDLQEIISYLIKELGRITTGNDKATKYHHLILGILEIIFYPDLIYPSLEREIHQGRKRIDITFDNAAFKGIFWRLSNNMKIPCQYIMVECKNYSTDPKNPELDQLSGRFSPNRGMVGFLLCRRINNINLFIDRCKDTYKDRRGLIIPFDDSDVIKLLNYAQVLDYSNIDKYISNRIRNITIS